MDTPSASSDTPLSVDSASQVFAALLDPPQEQAPSEAAEPEATPPEATEEDAPVEAADDQPSEEAEDGTVTIEVDGKPVTLSKQELADAYKNGLRQSDYTKKTMEVAEQRKAAEAEVAKARQEREAYQSNLQKLSNQLEGALQEQSQINWQQLLESDPVEYLKQQHLYQQRYAALQENQRQQAALAEHAKAEAEASHRSYLAQQQEALLAKLPDWTDASKASAEKQAIAKYLVDQGFEDGLISQISDHRQVLVARKAMLYDQMVSKASAAAKKVAQAPQKVIKPGVGDSPRVDGRSSAMQKLGKSGSVQDAAAVFRSIL